MIPQLPLPLLRRSSPRLTCLAIIAILAGSTVLSPRTLAQQVYYPSYSSTNQYSNNTQVIHSSPPPLPPGAVITSTRTIRSQPATSQPITTTRVIPQSTSQPPTTRSTSNSQNFQTKPAYQPRSLDSRQPTARVASTLVTQPSDRPRFPTNRFSDSQFANDRFTQGRQSTPSPFDSTYSLSTIDSARRAADRFRQLAQTRPEVIANLATTNADLVQQWIDLAGTQLDLANRLRIATKHLDTTRRDYDDVSAKLEQYGLTPTVGLLLQHKQDQLDIWQADDSQTLLAGTELLASRQQQLQLDMIRFDGSDPVEQTAMIMNEAGWNTSDGSQRASALDIQNLLQQRRQWIDALTLGYEDYQSELGKLDSVTTASVGLTNDYRRLINRHITWIRSGDPLSLTDVRNLKGGLGALFDSRRSADFGPTLERKLQSNAASGIGLLAWIVLAVMVRWRAKTWLVGIGARTKMPRATKNTRKLVAGLLTILVALCFPSILFVAARWLGSGVVSESTLHASAAFYAASLVALAMELSRQLMRDNGYLDQHVDVELPGRAGAMKYLTLFGLALCIAAYTVTLMGSIDHGIWRGSVARLGFMLAMAATSFLAHKALRPTGGWLEPLIAKIGGSVIHRVRVIVYLVGIGFPLAMAGLSVIGYGFTARELLSRAIWTFSAGLIAATLWPGMKIASAHAWNLLTGSKTTEKATRRFAHSDEDESKSQVTGVLGEHFLELKHHLAFLCQCGLVIAAIVGLGWLWIDVLPNSHLGNPVVWSVQDTDLQSTDVTLAHLLLAAATLFIAFQVAKLLPALFDALVLQRVSFDEGMEHFSLVLGRFLLFGVGCFIACRLIGIRWQTIQWLAVGLTIGLGFGLQDMVRNLFGGLIVLFEKPARLGDCVTVGSVTGRISAQRLRTTVLSDDEGREVIIPNKNFVSEDVVNWMGAGRLSVIPLEVAVTRDERPADICRTLQELVVDQPDVLLTPTPQATLVCVGQSSQRIEVRAWIEEGQNATRFRDNLLKIVRQDLQSRNLWVNNQPSQPEMNDTLSRELPDVDLLDDDLMDDDILDDFMTPKPKKRRRRA